MRLLSASYTLIEEENPVKFLAAKPAEEDEKVKVAVIGSNQGLAGRFNYIWRRYSAI